MQIRHFTCLESSMLPSAMEPAIVLYLDLLNVWQLDDRLSSSARVVNGKPNRYNSLIFHLYLMSKMVNKLCSSVKKQSLLVMVPSLILMNQLIISSYDTLTCVILIHQCPVDCPVKRHTVCN